MFGSDSDDWPDDVYKVFKNLRQQMQTMQPPKDWHQHMQTMQPPSPHDFEHWEFKRSFPVMELVVGLAVAGALVFLVVLLCRCCRRKTRGRVLAPPPAPGSEPAAPYPQQQFATQAYPATTVTVYPVGTASPYPAAVGPYPGGAPYPTASPYPAAGPYPGGAPSPYPPGAAAPYPATSPYPAGAPYPAVAPYGPGPTAPDANAFFGIAPPGWQPQACPPSYEQVMAHGEKQPPYNPHAPH